MKHNRKILMTVVCLFLLALPATSFAQGRGRGQEKKLDKFVNGHDARDGRWDGRGPGFSRRARIGNTIIRHRNADRLRNRDFERNQWIRSRRLRRNAFDNHEFLRRQKLRHRHPESQRRGF